MALRAEVMISECRVFSRLCSSAFVFNDYCLRLRPTCIFMIITFYWYGCEIQLSDDDARTPVGIFVSCLSVE